MKGFTAALMQFRISVSHVPDFEQTVPFSLGTYVSMNEHHSWNQDIFAFAVFLFVYFSLHSNLLMNSSKDAASSLHAPPV